MSVPHDLRAGYSGASVLVTGHTGFKGAWLCAWLLRLGSRVTGIALPPEPGRPSLFSAARIGEGIDSRIGDIRDPALVRTILDETRPDVVFHLAAQSLVRRSYGDPLGTFATNVLGTAHVLEAIRHTPSVRAAVIITSDKCYENREWDRAYREDDAMGGHDPYSASKGCAELVTASYRRAFCADGPPVASGRAGNVIGGGDWAEDRLVPDIALAASRGQPVTLRNPAAIRPWQHVLEPLRGYLLLGLALMRHGTAFAEPWNFGPRAADAIAVGDVARRIAARWNRVDVRLAPQSAGPHEAGILTLDSSKAEQRLGWEPVLSLDDALELTIAWYRDFDANPESARPMVDSQLEAYERMLTTRSTTT